MKQYTDHMTGTVSLLPPPGCKAVIYEAPESWGSWASHGTDVWYVGPLRDHYWSNHFFVPNTTAYQLSGSAELFLQKCQVPFLMCNEHLQEVIDKLVTTLHKLPPPKTSLYPVPCHGQTVCTTPCCSTTLFDTLITQMAPAQGGHSINTIYAPVPTNWHTKGGTKGECPQHTTTRQPKQRPNTHQDYWCSSHHERSQSHSKVHFEVK